MRKRGREAGETPHRKMGVSDPQRNCIRRPQLAVLRLTRRSRPKSGVVGNHNFVDLLLLWVPQTARSTEKKDPNAQGIRHRHINSPVPHHDMSSGRTPHHSISVSTRTVLHEGQAMLRCNESQGNVFVTPYSWRPYSTRRLCLTNHGGDPTLGET